MKKILNYIFLIAGVLAMSSCESDLDNIFVDSPAVAKESVLTSEGQTNILASDENLNQYATIFNWTRTLMGNTEIPVTYTLQVDTTDNFQNPHLISVGTNNLSKAFTYSEINQWGLDFATDSTGTEPLSLFVRVAGSVLTQNNDLVIPTDSVYSNFLALSVTPYFSAPATIYVATDLSGDFSTNSPKLYSEKRDGIYLGYVYLNAEFKIAPSGSWNGALGGGDGKLEGDNPIASTPGFYWMQVDLNTNTYKITSVSFGIIGSINGNWDVDSPMTYDVQKNVLSITADFNAGEFKFRRDGSWDIGLGLNADGELVQDGGASNIPLSPTGNYTITLNLWDYLNPSYTITLN